MRGRMQRVVYGVVRGALWLVLGPALRISVQGSENVPRDGAVVLAANHRHNIDPLVLGVAARRPVSFMAKAELFSVPLLGRLIPMIYAFPVHRGAGDRAALRAAGEVLKRGGVLGIFPEGTRQPGPELGEPHMGAALLALQEGTPIVPVAILGTDRITRPGSRLPRLPKVRVRFAEALLPAADPTDRKKEIRRLTDLMMDGIARAGDFPPRGSVERVGVGRSEEAGRRSTSPTGQGRTGEARS